MHSTFVGLPLYWQYWYLELVFYNWVFKIRTGTCLDFKIQKKKKEYLIYKWEKYHLNPIIHHLQFYICIYIKKFAIACSYLFELSYKIPNQDDLKPSSAYFYLKKPFLSTFVSHIFIANPTKYNDT